MNQWYGPCYNCHITGYVSLPTPWRLADTNSPEASCPECLALLWEYLVLLVGERKAGGQHRVAHLHPPLQPQHGEVVATEGLSEVVVWMEVNLGRSDPHNVRTVLLHLSDITHPEVDLEVSWVPELSTNNQWLFVLVLVLKHYLEALKPWAVVRTCISSMRTPEKTEGEL